MKKIKILSFVIFIIDILVLLLSYLFCSMKWKHTISKETLMYYHIGLVLKNAGIIIIVILITLLIISIFLKYKHK